MDLLICEHLAVPRAHPIAINAARDRTPVAADRSGHYVALAGEFFVLAELALRRLDGILMLGHTKEIDILALNRRTGRTFRVEVKTTTSGLRGSRRPGLWGPCYAWVMDVRHGDLAAGDLVYAFVIITEERPKMFLVPSEDVAAYIRWEYGHWVKHARRRTGKLSSMRMFRIPTESACPMPSAWKDRRWQRWQDNWSVFGPTAQRRTANRAASASP